MSQSKNLTERARQMSQTATDLTLDQYIKRYAKTVKTLSMDDYFLSLYDANKDGKIGSMAELRAYNKLSGDDKQRMYTEYLDSVAKLNAYYKREAEKEWEAAHYFSGENVEYSNAFGNTSNYTGARTGAVERLDNENKDIAIKSALNFGNIVLYAGLAILLILLLKK